MNKNGDRINLQSYLIFGPFLTANRSGIYDEWAVRKMRFSLMIYGTNPSSILEIEMRTLNTIYNFLGFRKFEKSLRGISGAIFSIQAHFENLQWITYFLAPSKNVTLKMTIECLEIQEP